MIQKEIREYIHVQCEQNSSDTAIAKKVKREFGLNIELEKLRGKVRSVRKTDKIKALNRPIKRMFFDIETTYVNARVWDTGKQYIRGDQITTEKKIICISYKWQGDDTVQTLRWDKKQDDGKMIKKFIKIMAQADEIIAHNGDGFDVKELRTRCIRHGILMYPTYRTLDTLKKARQYFKFMSNSLDYIGKFLEEGKKLDHDGMQMWIDIVENNDNEALEKMVKYCEQDVILLEDVYAAMSPYIWHNNNFAVLTGSEKWDCPECSSNNVEMYRTYTTAMGVIRRNMKCADCSKQYRISNRSYLQMLKNITSSGK